MLKKDTLEKIYAGFLGMNVGIRLGAPVEPTIWTYERIRDTYGDITGYVKEYKNFAADDDANGPVFFIRALYDACKNAPDTPLEPWQVGEAWLNYSREGKGMFWWGGYGVSTEHTAYLNLINGIPAPDSGSMAVNGRTEAEQIGGQIFIDTFGLVWPGNPDMAVRYGEAAARVSHDGAGVHGARFFTAAIAKAFVCDDIKEITAAALEYLPEDCQYRQVAEAVWACYRSNPSDFRVCRQMLEERFGYDKYPGVCHMIPNAGVCILSMLYGEGDFARTVEIATMCGWDTDCNAGNVGTVLGVLCGLSGIPAHYREPINDGIVLSSISGYLNNLDIPTFSKELYTLACRLAKETPDPAVRLPVPGEVHLDFELPGSTHNIRVSDPFLCGIENCEGEHFTGGRSLKILMDRLVRGDTCKIFYKPYYNRADFSDERYSPVFSPTVYSGQQVSIRLKLELLNGNEAPFVAPYVRLANSGKELIQGLTRLVEGEWAMLSFIVPDSEGDLIDQVGFVLEGASPGKAKTLGFLYMDDFSITGDYRQNITLAKQKKNFGELSPFSTNHGATNLEDGLLVRQSVGFCEAYTGNYYAKDSSIECDVTPLYGNSHLLAVRTKGAREGYFGGLSEPGKVALYRQRVGEIQKLAETDYQWETGQRCHLKLSAAGETLTLTVDGVDCLSATDDSCGYGMVGLARLETGRTGYGDFTITGRV